MTTSSAIANRTFLKKPSKFLSSRISTVWTFSRTKAWNKKFLRKWVWLTTWQRRTHRQSWHSSTAWYLKKKKTWSTIITASIHELSRGPITWWSMMTSTTFKRHLESSRRYSSRSRMPMPLSMELAQGSILYVLTPLRKIIISCSGSAKRRR